MKNKLSTSIVKINLHKIICNTIRFFLIIIIIGIIFFSGYLLGGFHHEDPKGNGENFYVEILPGQRNNRPYVLYHSIPSCKNISKGITYINDFHFCIDPSNRPLVDDVVFRYCPICMDDYLIFKCELESKKDDNKYFIYIGGWDF